jgi:hypothetical protein
MNGSTSCVLSECSKESNKSEIKDSFNWEVCSSATVASLSGADSTGPFHCNIFNRGTLLTLKRWGHLKGCNLLQAKSLRYFISNWFLEMSWLMISKSS